jgi:hypothetical protein
MTDKPHRPWFQIHLTTAIVLMLVAGVFIGVNTVQRKAKYVRVQADQWYQKAAYGKGNCKVPLSVTSLVQPVTLYEAGWPIKIPATVQLKNYSIEVKDWEFDPLYSNYADELSLLKKYRDTLIPFDEFARLAPTIEKETGVSNRETESSQSVWAAPLPYTILAKNAAVGLSVLIGVAIVLEYLLRRREALRS